MPRTNASLLALNRGEVSRHALARVDLEKMRLAAEEQVNFMPFVLGPMMLRPGLQYIGGVRGDLACRLVPFVFSNSDFALLELTPSTLRVWTLAGDTETLVTRPAVATTVVNGDFSSGTGWTLTQTGAGASAAISGGKLTMASPAAGGLAQAKRTVTISGGDEATEHGFRIVVERGPIRFRAGSSDGADDIIRQTTLGTGTHSLAFTPNTATVHIQLETITAQQKIVEAVTIDAAGTLELPTNWAADDLPFVRTAQSGDIVFTACRGQQQRKIERRGVRSWSVVLHTSDNGPFQVGNGTDITLTPGALSGNTTLTASRALFRPAHAGCLFRLFSSGQQTNNNLAAANTFSSAVRVTGVSGDRVFNYAITGTWSGTLTLQRSLDSESSGFVDVTTFTGNSTSTYNDGLNNTIAWYRIGFKTGQYTSGTATIALTYTGGGAAGIGRVTGYTSPTVVNVEVLTPFSSLNATSDWNEGDWSDVIGWPSAVAFHDGRLWQAGRDKIWGSVSDDYGSHDIDFEGDAGPINRSVGFGPVDVINWLLPLTRLIVGREGAETSIRSSSFDEPLTPTNFTLKDCSTQGSAPIAAVKIDTRGVFVQQSNRRAYELGFNVEIADYAPHDLTRLNPDIGMDGFVDLAVQRQPDTQLHFVRSDGQVAALLHDIEDGVEAWWRIATPGGDGAIEAVAILPGAQENRVYYAVRRTIGGNTRRFIEKLARRDQCTGQPGSRCADSHIVYSGTATATISGLSHLDGETVVVWGHNDDDETGRDLGAHIVESGQIALPVAVENACVGFGYDARFTSAKLAYAAQRGTALTQTKKLNRLGLILADTHAQGIRFGQLHEVLDALPLVEDGEDIAEDHVWRDFDRAMVPVPGEWDTDARLCLQANAPRPCTVMAVVVDVTTHE